MAINPMALQVTTPDTVGKAFEGFEYGRQIKGQNVLAANGMAASTGDRNALAAIYEAAPQDAMKLQAAAGANAKSENAARLAKFGNIGNMAGAIGRLPPDQQGPALEQAKGVIATMYGNDPQVVGILQQVTPENIGFYAEALTDEMTRLKQDLTGAKIGTEVMRGQDIGIDNARADRQTAANIANANARTGGYLSNIGDMIGKRADGNAPGALKAPSGYRFTETGDLAFIPGGPADPKNKGANGGVTVGPDGTVTVAPGGKLTEGQSKDVVLARRASRAAKNLETLDTALADLGEVSVGGIPVAGNYLVSKEYQRAEQQGRELLSAFLRKETGAAVTPQEWEYYGPMLLPVPGDDPETIAQKALTRRQMVEDITVGLGNMGGLVNQGNGQPGSGPQPGTVEDGYRFKGGNPADPNSWERAN